MTPALTVLAAMLALAAGPEGSPPAAADAASCRPALGPQLRPGAWGLVRLEATRGSAGGPAAPELVQEIRGAEHAVASGPPLGAGQSRRYLVPFRPLVGAGEPALRFGSGARVRPAEADALTGPADERLVAVVGRIALPASSPSGFHILPTDPAELPEYPAAYEGLDLLVIGEFDAAALRPAARQALSAWFRAGGRVFIASTRARRELADVFPAESEAPGASGVGRFHAGFGLGAFPRSADAGLTEAEAQAAWALAALPGRNEAVPAVDGGLYRDFPALDSSLLGAPAALRWGLGTMLALGVALAVFWRRAHPWRTAGAAAGAALVAAALVGTLARAPEGRALGFRIDEFSADGAGARAREFLRLELAGRSWSPEIRAAAGVLPALVLDRWEAAGEFSTRLALGGPESAPGATLTVRALEADGRRALFVGAGPLAGAAPLALPPPGAQKVCYLGGLNRAGAVAAIADCLAPRAGRFRKQAEALAEWVWNDLHARGLVGGNETVTVCRLPAVEPTLTVAGPAVAARLGRLGIFHSRGGS